MNTRITLRMLALLVAGTTNAFAAIESFLYVPGVPGESLDPEFRGWIDLNTVSVSVSDRVCDGFVVTKQLDSSSPVLSASALSGILFPTMTVQVEKSGEGERPFLTYSLTNVVVNAVNVTISPAGELVETMVFHPTVIAMTYRPQGGIGSPIQNTLNCKYK